MLTEGRQAEQTIVYDPVSGRPIMAQGTDVAGTVPVIPERQSQIQLFGTMMDVTAPVINEIETTYDPSNLADAAAARLGWAGNYMRQEDAQRYETAAAAWAEGALRLATGAAALDSEVLRTRNTYFAVPGDTPETVAFKRQLRGAYQQALINASAGGFQPGDNTLPPDPLAFATQVAPGAVAQEQAGATAEPSIDDLLNMYAPEGGQ
jgi:hypothetical protein